MLRIEVQMNLQTFCEQIYPPLPGIARRVAAFDVTALTTYQTRFSWNEQHRPTCSNRTIETTLLLIVVFLFLFFPFFIAQYLVGLFDNVILIGQ